MFWFLVTTPAFVVAVQSPSRVRLFATAWIPTRQASLSFTISWSLPKFMFIASVMPALPPCFFVFFFLIVPVSASSDYCNKYYRLGGLNNKHSLLTVLEAGHPR